MICVTPSGITNSVISFPLSSEKCSAKESPILKELLIQNFTSVMYKSVRLLQPEKAYESILVTPSPITTLSSELQFMNAVLLIFVVLLLLMITSFKFEGT